jgi:hypothetical protein
MDSTRLLLPLLPWEFDIFLVGSPLSLNNALKLVLFPGGVNTVGFLVGWFKTAKYRFGLDKFGQGLF